MRSDRLQHLLRELAPQVLGSLVRRFRDFSACEDAVQEALLAASLQWPKAAMPENPRGWLIQVAARRLTDRVRADAARRHREELVVSLIPPDEQLAAPGGGVRGVTMRAALWLRWIACGLVGALAASCGRSGACEGTAEFACMQCCTDNGAAAECHDGQWRCPAGFVDPTTCNQDCNPPPSSMRLCVEPDAGVCLDNCGNQEVCIAVPACSSDGGPCIGTDGGGVFEARCHRHCDSYDRCSPQEVCRRYVPASCAPGSTAPYVCCGPGSCPP